ncbi:MAG: hypothetical protein VKL42_12465 [Snowella sp.]|nr:hypothetical protein [Snowella sp.]
MSSDLFFWGLIVVAIIGSRHSFDIPGLDYCHCQDCDRWIATEHGLNLLINQANRAKKGDRKKELSELQKEIAREKNLQTKCKFLEGEYV